VAFVTAWATLGAGAAGYDPTRDAISRLAAYGAPTRVGMTAGLVALGAGMGLYGLALRPRPVWILPVVNGGITLAVAAFALGGNDDTAHGVFAGRAPAGVGGHRRGLRAVPAADDGRRPGRAVPARRADHRPRLGRGQRAGPAAIPHTVVHDSSGSSTRRPSPLTKALGAQVMGSTARLRRRRPGASVSPVNTITQR
jgi:hypothetical protein